MDKRDEKGWTKGMETRENNSHGEGEFFGSQGNGRRKMPNQRASREFDSFVFPFRSLESAVRRHVGKSQSQTPRCKNGPQGNSLSQVATDFCQGNSLTHHKGFPYFATESNDATTAVRSHAIFFPVDFMAAAAAAAAAVVMVVGGIRGYEAGQCCVSATPVRGPSSPSLPQGYLNLANEMCCELSRSKRLMYSPFPFCSDSIDEYALEPL